MSSRKEDKNQVKPKGPLAKSESAANENTSGEKVAEEEMATEKKTEGKSAAQKEEAITIGKAEYERLKETLKLAEDYKDKYLRAHAELDNFRKRLIKEKEEFIKFANEDLLNEILYVIDNFDRALGHMNGTQKVESILEGVKMIQKQFHLFLEQRDVKKIESVGKKFDPALHEAVEHIEVEPDKEDIVIEEIQPGYQLNERLLRPAIVKVGKKK